MLVVNSNKLESFYEGGSANVFSCFAYVGAQWARGGNAKLEVPSGVGSRSITGSGALTVSLDARDIQ